MQIYKELRAKSSQQIFAATEISFFILFGCEKILNFLPTISMKGLFGQQVLCAIIILVIFPTIIYRR